MDMRFSLSNIWSVGGFSICHVSVNSYNIEKLEIVVEDITCAPPFARSCLGTRTEASGGVGSGQGPILSQGWYTTPPWTCVLLITPTSPALLGVEQGAWHGIYLFMGLRGWSSHINMQN